MRKTLTVLIVAIGLAAGRAMAQQPITFAVEPRGAFAIPTGEWTDEDTLGNGYGFGANAQVHFGAFGAYLGWERFTFTMDDADFEVDEANTHDTGFRGGLLATVPLGPTVPVSPFVLVGAILNKTAVKVGDDGGSIEFESENGLGFEVGAGVAVPPGPTMAFTPAVRYRTHSAEFEAFEDFGDNKSTVSYFLVDLGLRIAVGR